MDLTMVSDEHHQWVPLPYQHVVVTSVGWNSWNYFTCNINEGIVRSMADAIVSTGLKDLGYTYVVRAVYSLK